MNPPYRPRLMSVSEIGQVKLYNALFQWHNVRNGNDHELHDSAASDALDSSAHDQPSHVLRSSAHCGTELYMGISEHLKDLRSWSTYQKDEYGRVKNWLAPCGSGVFKSVG